MGFPGGAIDKEPNAGDVRDAGRLGLEKWRRGRMVERGQLRTWQTPGQGRDTGALGTVGQRSPCLPG